MQNFEYYTPTKVVFGKDAELKTGELIREQGGTKVLLHYGGGSAERSGLLGRIRKSLKEAGLDYVELGGVQPNPRLSLAKKGIELAKEAGVDFILAVGGGSVIDSSKCIGYGLYNGGDVWDFYLKTRVPEGCIPVGAVLTIAAAGSEMSNSSVISNEDGNLKRGCNNNHCRCRFAVLNPELTYTLGAYQTACGCVDMMMHILERYISTAEDTTITDGMSESILRTIMYFAPKAVAEPENYNARAQIMWAGSLAHNGLLGCGMTEDWASHQLEHELSAMFDVAHGAGLAAVWGSWARYVLDVCPERFANFADKVLGIPYNVQNPKQTALDGIAKLETFFRSLGMPASVHEMGIDLTDEQIDELAYRCSFKETRTIGGFKKLDRKDIEQIYRMAR